MNLKFHEVPEWTERVRPLHAGNPNIELIGAFRGVIGDKEILHAIVTRDNISPTSSPDWRWHISFSAEGRVPEWNEIAGGCHELRPGVPFALGVPPKSWWLNVHPHVLHATETKDDNLVNSWREQRRGDRPS